MTLKLKVNDLVNPCSPSYKKAYKYGKITMIYKGINGNGKTEMIARVDWYNRITRKPSNVNDHWLKMLEKYEPQNHPLTKIFKDLV